MTVEATQITLGNAILAVAISDISLAFDNALANSQMVAGLAKPQQKKALLFGLLLSCLTMIVCTALVVQIRSHFDWIRYPAGLWLIYVVFKLWFDRHDQAPGAVAGAMMKAIFLITLNDLTLQADNAIANSEFALRAAQMNGHIHMDRLWTVLIFGLLLSCVFMIICTYAIVWIRRFADWIRYPAGLWLLVVAVLILTGAQHHP